MPTATKRKGSKPESCRIIVVDDVFGTRTEVESPQSGKEAVDNHGHAKPAVDWFLSHSDDDDDPVGLSIQYSDDLVIVHWYPTGNLDDAKAARCGDGRALQ